MHRDAAVIDRVSAEETLGLSLRGPIKAGFLISALTFGGFGAIASFTKITGAVTAPGKIVVESWTKKVQHNEGGIVADILVDDGFEVRQGDLLLRLDDTQTRAKLTIVNKQLAQQQARLVRLKAERDDRAAPDFASPRSEDEAEAVATERLLFSARRWSLVNQKEQLAQQVIEKEREIDGFEADIQSIDEQFVVASKEHGDLSQLFAKKYVTQTRVLQLEREIAGLRGRHGQRIADIARTREQIAEIKVQLVRLDADFKRDVLTELAAVEVKTAELVEQKIQAEDFLTRIEVRAPQSGIVHELAVHTKGGVVRPTDILMIIVPKGDKLVVEARVSPQDIDQVAVGQPAVVRFTNFNRPTTPDLNAWLTRVSADVAIDQPGQPWSGRPTAAVGTSQQLAPYYGARIEIPDDELKKLDGAKLIPGMQVDTFITTSERTVMSYLMKPVQDRLTRVMRER